MLAKMPPALPEKREQSKLYLQDAATRAANYARMQQVLAHIEATVPGAQRAADSAGRSATSPSTTAEFTQLPRSASTSVWR